MKNKIETSVFGRGDEELKTFNNLTAIFMIVVEFLAFMLAFFIYTNYPHCSNRVILLFVITLSPLFVYFYFIEDIIKNKFYKEKPVWKYVVRKVTTNIGKDYYSVFSEAYDGRYKDFSYTQDKATNGEPSKFLFDMTEDQNEIDEFIETLIAGDKEREIRNQRIVKIHE